MFACSLTNSEDLLASVNHYPSIDRAQDASPKQVVEGSIIAILNNGLLYASFRSDYRQKGQRDDIVAQQIRS